MGLDPLRDEGIAYATALKAAGYVYHLTPSSIFIPYYSFAWHRGRVLMIVCGQNWMYTQVYHMVSPCSPIYLLLNLGWNDLLKLSNGFWRRNRSSRALVDWISPNLIRIARSSIEKCWIQVNHYLKCVKREKTWTDTTFGVILGAVDGISSDDTDLTSLVFIGDIGCFRKIPHGARTTWRIFPWFSGAQLLPRSISPRHESCNRSEVYIHRLSKSPVCTTI